jgi:hypothetical protein
MRALFFDGSYTTVGPKYSRRAEKFYAAASETPEPRLMDAERSEED